MQNLDSGLDAGGLEDLNSPSQQTSHPHWTRGSDDDSCFFWFVPRKWGVEISPKSMRFWEDRMFFWRLGVWFFDFQSLTSQYPGARGIYVVWGEVRARKLKEIAENIFWFVGSLCVIALAHYINKKHFPSKSLHAQDPFEGSGFLW